MTLYGCCYASTSTSLFHIDTLGDLVARSREQNAAQGITGCLLFDGARFVQVLEGPEPAVRAMLERIVADPRHQGGRMIWSGMLTERCFDGYSMRSLNLAMAPSGRPGLAELKRVLSQLIESSRERLLAYPLFETFCNACNRVPDATGGGRSARSSEKSAVQGLVDGLRVRSTPQVDYEYKAVG